MLNNILGGPGMNSRLNLAVREKYGLVYTIDSSYSPYTDTGLFGIYFGTEAKAAHPHPGPGAEGAEACCATRS